MPVRAVAPVCVTALVCVAALATACGAGPKGSTVPPPVTRTGTSLAPAPAPAPATVVTPPTPARTASSTIGSGPVGARRFDHIVVVVEENRGYGTVLGSGAAPYLDSLAASGASYLDYHGVTHPSQPNYLALFSGSTQGVAGDSCPQRLAAPNLAGQLIDAGLRFAGYSEGLPEPGYSGCSSGAYARKHAPWTDFPALPPTVGQPMSAFPTDFDTLPQVAFVIPDLNHDMHDGSVSAGDAWLRSHLESYAEWSRSHRSLLVVTWDEDDFTAENHIATIAVGAGVGPLRPAQRQDHYALLRTIEDDFGLPPLGAAAQRQSLPGLG